MKNWKYLALVGLSLCLASLLLNTSCVSQRTVRDLVAQHTLELHQVNNQLTQANDELIRQTEMLDSLMGLPEQIREVIITQDRIIDNTDSLVIINNNMLRILHRVEWNTDTILQLLRSEPTLFDDKF